MGAVGGTAFLITLVTLVAVPRDARRRAALIAPQPNEWRDTTAPLAAVSAAGIRLARIDSALRATRTTLANETVLATGPTMSPSDIARRDSLTRIDAALTPLLARVENAPLPASYRALGEASQLRDDSRVRALLDSLTDVEREREEFGAGAGVDPVFVALPARATGYGRAIQAIAEAKRDGARRDLASLSSDSARIVAPVFTQVDTLRFVVLRDSITRDQDRAVRALAAARVTNATLGRRAELAREQATVVAPPFAILISSIVLGFAVGFGWLLFGEMRVPRVSDLVETELLTGARVLAVLRPRLIPPERARRRADQKLPPFIDPTADAHRLLASHLSMEGTASVARGLSQPGSAVTIAGDVGAVTAIVASNIAAASANESRSTLLVDVDLERGPIARALQARSVPGLAAVLDRGVEWSGAIVQVAVGRDRSLDIIPSSGAERTALSDEEAEQVIRELERSARRYDLVLLHLPLDVAPRVRLTNEVVVCVHMAHTPLDVLRDRVVGIRERGARVTGIVIWDADAPTLGPPVTEEPRYTTEEMRTVA
jgi:Mrp family chromosome partitioning ATPase